MAEMLYHTSSCVHKAMVGKMHYDQECFVFEKLDETVELQNMEGLG